MSGIQPENMSTEELLKYVWLQNFDVPPAWVEEICRRLEDTLDDNK